MTRIAVEQADEVRGNLMKKVRFVLLLLFIPFVFTWPSTAFYAGNARHSDLPLLPRPLGGVQMEDPYGMMRINIVPRPIDGGITEEVPSKYRERFEKWKAEFRSTEIGRGHAAIQNTFFSRKYSGIQTGRLNSLILTSFVS